MRRKLLLLQFLAGGVCLWSVRLWLAAWTIHLQVSEAFNTSLIHYNE